MSAGLGGVPGAEEDAAASCRAVAAAVGLDATGAEGAAAGTDLEHRWDPQGTVELLADALAALHRVPLAADAVDGMLSPAAVAAAACARIESGVVPDLDPAYAHVPPERLASILAEGAGAVAGGAPVLTHGRPGPATLRLRGGVAIGFADWTDAAPADRHRDLAWAATEVASTLGPMLVPVLFERYGARPDPRRLDWWALAHQLARPPAGHAADLPSREQRRGGRDG